MDQLKSKLYAEINELRNKSDAEIIAILKAREDLKNSLDYMLLLVKEMNSEHENKLQFVKAHNPQLEEEFVRVNIENTGYPSLIKILENIIGQERERIYWEKVQKKFEGLKTSFTNTLQKSGDRKSLLSGEIEQYETLLLGKGNYQFRAENDSIWIGEGLYKLMQIRRCRELYQKLIVRGNREYHLTQIEESGVGGSSNDLYHIQVEAFSKYLNWLRELNSLNETIKPVDRKFYIDEDFRDLTNNLLNIDEFRVDDFLDSHLRKSSEQPLNFAQALRNFLLVDCSFNEPIIRGKYGFAVDVNDTTPQQIRQAYLWIHNKISNLVKEVNDRANPEFKKIDELSETDYINICEKLKGLESKAEDPSVIKSTKQLDFEIEYKKFLLEVKASYENKEIVKIDSKPSIRQIVLTYYYNGEVIEKGKRHDMAKLYGFKGDAFYNRYVKILDDNERQKPTPSNIKDLQKVILQLSGKSKKMAETDLKEAQENL